MTRIPSSELFPTDGPIPPDRMIVRQEDAAALAQMLIGGMNRIVAGPRRTGKTTVCRAALARAKRGGHYVVAVDLFRVADIGGLAEALVTAAIANRPGLRKILDRARRLGAAALRAAAMRTVIKAQAELGEEIEIAIEPGLASRNPDRYLTYAFELMQRIAEADGKRLILFLDEFQEIAGEGKRFGDPDALTKRMRAILQDSDRVTCLFAGSVEHLMRDLFTPRRRAFFQFGGFYELAPTDPDAWKLGLDRRLAEDRTTIDPPALARLIALSELHPRATMLLAQQTHAAAVTLDLHAIDTALVEQGYQLARAADRPNHETTTERIRSLQKHAFAIAQRIARSQPTYENLTPALAQRALKALRNAGIVEHHGHGDWKITDPLLRSYLAEIDPVF